MNKREYINYAHALGWTKADAERAFNLVAEQGGLNSELEVLKTLVRFAGRELAERQRLQASQKAQATRNRNEKTKLEEEIIDVTKGFETRLDAERGYWRGILDKINRKLKVMGISLTWIEDLLKRG